MELIYNISLFNITRKNNQIKNSMYMKHFFPNSILRCMNIGHIFSVIISNWTVKWQIYLKPLAR